MPNEIDNFTNEYSFLSNFYMCTIECLDDNYPSAEHAYQAMKTKDPSIREKIRNCKTPGQAKKIGNEISLRPNWNQMKYDIMLDIVFSKFDQNPNLKEKLLSTGDSNLIERNNWHDTYWGICNGVGENKLGEILMIIRKNFKRKVILNDT